MTAGQCRSARRMRARNGTLPHTIRMHLRFLPTTRRFLNLRRCGRARIRCSAFAHYIVIGCRVVCRLHPWISGHSRQPYDPNSTTAPLLGKSGRLERLSLPLLTGSCKASSFPRLLRSGRPGLLSANASPCLTIRITQSEVSDCRGDAERQEFRKHQQGGARSSGGHQRKA